MRDYIAASTKPAHAGTIRLANAAVWNLPAVYLQSMGGDEELVYTSPLEQG